ncbi:MAG: GNAT family N-acetyltransferase [Pararhodobacter sp.]
MTPDDLARLHRAAFAFPPPWSAAAFATTLAQPAVFLLASPCGQAFVLGRVVAGEAELLTLATAPAARRQGLARGLLQGFDKAATERGATTAFLEVAETNTAAMALYAATGWITAGRRPGYYHCPADRTDQGGQGRPIAALVLQKPLR